MIWHNVEHQYTQGNTKTTTRHESHYYQLRIRRDRHSMVFGFTTICAFSAYHHLCCEFEPLHGKVYSIQHYVIKFVSDFLLVLLFAQPIKLTATI